MPHLAEAAHGITGEPREDHPTEVDRMAPRSPSAEGREKYHSLMKTIGAFLAISFLFSVVIVFACSEPDALFSPLRYH